MWYNTSIVYAGSGYRPVCVVWHNTSSVWNVTGVSTGTIDQYGGSAECLFTMNQYFNGPYTVVKQIAPTPEVLTVYAYPSNVSIQINFDLPTDQGSTGITPCATWFTAATISLIGSGAVCQWGDAQSLQVTEFNPTVMVGMTLSLNAGTYYSLDGFSNVNLAITTPAITLPITETATHPVPLLSGPAASGFCQSASFSAASSVGDAGLAMSYSWDVVNAATGIAPSGGTLLGLGSAYTVLNFTSSLATGTYFLTLTLTNWLSLSSTINSTFIKSSLSVPVVTFSPASSFFISRSTSFTVIATATASPCTSSSVTPTITLAWSVLSYPSSSAPLLTIASPSAAEVDFDPYAFIPGIYVLQLVATQSGSGTASNIATVTINVARTAAPQRLYAQFNLALTRIDVTFDSPTNLIGNQNWLRSCLLRRSHCWARELTFNACGRPPQCSVWCWVPTLRLGMAAPLM